MLGAGVPFDIDSKGKELRNEKPEGADQEWKQPAKTLNHEGPKRARLEKRRKQASEKFSKELIQYNTITDVLRKNGAVEEEVKSMTATGVLTDASIETVFSLKPADKLRWLIHARKFKDSKFHAAALTGDSGRLNKTVFPGQTAEEIAENCSVTNPCLVWWAWKLLRENTPLTLVAPPQPVIDLTVRTPNFDVIYAGLRESSIVRAPSSFLDNAHWLDGVKGNIKGVRFGEVTQDMKDRADKLCPALEMRLKCHISEKVDDSRHDHYSLPFVSENLPPMSALLCLVGHVVEYLDT